MNCKDLIHHYILLITIFTSLWYSNVYMWSKETISIDKIALSSPLSINSTLSGKILNTPREDIMHSNFIFSKLTTALLSKQQLLLRKKEKERSDS